MLSRRISVGLWCLLFLSCNTSVLWASQLSVYEGDYATYALQYSISRLAIGDASVADYKAERNPKGGVDLLVNGKKPGTTNLLIYDAQGQLKEEVTINVLVKNLEEYKQQLEAVLGSIEGLDMRVVSGKLILEGEVATPREMERILMVVGNSPQIMNMVMISPHSLQIVAKTIQDKLNDSSLRVMAVGQNIILEGVVFNPAAADRHERMAKLYYPHITNLLEIRESGFAPGFDDMVQITAHFMEVSESAIRGWGINWSPMGTGQITGSQDISGGGGFTGALTGTISSLFPKLSVAKEAGEARVLETASMSVRSGDAVNFHSGGEMGVPTTQGTGATTITFKKYGVMANVLPVVQGDKISMKLDIEVSAPSGTSPGGGINFVTSNISTVQWCNSGDSIVIGGLLSQRDAKLFDQLPDGAGGAIVQLYKSENFRRQQSQFVMFVTPMTLAGGAVDANREIMGIVEERFMEYEPDKR